MKLRPAEINHNGLALPPTSIDCLGDECAITKKRGRCFSDRHHLYFYKDRFDAQGPKSLPYRMRHDPFNITWITRCRHDQIHKTQEAAYIPAQDVMERFLDEANLLRDLGVSAIRLASLELDLDFDNNFKPYKPKQLKGQSILEQMEIQKEKVSNYGRLIAVMEVLPPQFIDNPLRVVYTQAPSNVVQSATEYLASAQLLSA